MSATTVPPATAEPVAPAPAPRRVPVPRAFRQLLVNTLATGITGSFLWFALTFWVFLETRSVVATGMIGGAFALSSAVLGPVFGTYVDRHRKHQALVLTSVTSTVSFTAATATFLLVDPADLLELTRPWFWLLTATTLLGSVAGQLRGIALSTCVTLLVPEGQRDRANGMVGTVNGLSFAITSVFSGLVIGFLGMGWAIYVSLALTAGALVHIRTIHFDEPEPAPADPSAPRRPTVDVRGAVAAIRLVPGLGFLIGLAAFNNMLSGVFMALVDAYGLSLVSVETWGILWGFICMSMVVGGIVVSRRGLGPNPVRVVLLGNLANWVVCIFFPIRSSVVLVTIGMVVWLALIPAIEAAEQTILQRAIPYEQQGRVFGFAQLVENAASPLTAFLMAPLAETVFIPTMTDGAGADLIGSWYGTGPDRGLAIMFTLAGIVGVVVTVGALLSPAYRRLSAASKVKPRGGSDSAPSPVVA
jgi:DHA3 family multidrug efflux protein-like MFS transporter